MKYLILLLVLVAACNTPSRLIRKHDKIEAKCNTPKTDTVGAHWCNTRKPVKIGKGTVKYIQGKPVVTMQYDTITVDCDTIRSVIRVPVPTYKTVHVTDTVYTRDTFENTNQITLLQASEKGWIDEASKYKQKYEAAQAKVSKRNWWIVILAAVIAGLVGLWVWSKIGIKAFI